MEFSEKENACLCKTLRLYDIIPKKKTRLCRRRKNHFGGVRLCFSRRNFSGICTHQLGLFVRTAQGRERRLALVERDLTGAAIGGKVGGMLGVEGFRVQKELRQPLDADNVLLRPDGGR